MQVAWQISQSTFAWSVAGPGFAVPATLSVSGNRTSSSYPKSIRGPSGRRFGAGNCNGPAVMPAGKVQRMCGGSPASPAFFQ